MRMASKANADDFFRCQQYLYDYDEWCVHVMHGQYFDGFGYAALVLAAATSRIWEKIRYFESWGYCFEPPEDAFWVSAETMSTLVETGQWRPFSLREHSGYPPAASV